MCCWNRQGLWNEASCIISFHDPNPFELVNCDYKLVSIKIRLEISCRFSNTEKHTKKLMQEIIWINLKLARIDGCMHFVTIWCFHIYNKLIMWLILCLLTMTSNLSLVVMQESYKGKRSNTGYYKDNTQSIDVAVCRI